jgi:hypothetical protein
VRRSRKCALVVAVTVAMVVAVAVAVRGWQDFQPACRRIRLKLVLDDRST